MNLVYIGDITEACEVEAALKAYTYGSRFFTTDFRRVSQSLLAQQRPDVVFLDLDEPDVNLQDIRPYLGGAMLYLTATPKADGSLPELPPDAVDLLPKPLVPAVLRSVMRLLASAEARFDHNADILRGAELSSNGIAVFQAGDRKLIYANSSLSSILGISLDAVLGMTSDKLFPMAEQQRLLDELHASMATGNDMWAGVVSGIRKNDGVAYTVFATVRNCMKREGRKETYFLEFRDITEEVRAQTELRRLAQVVVQSSDATVITDMNNKIVYVNPAFERMTGYTAEEALGKTPALLKSGEMSAEFYKNLWSVLLSGQSWRGEFVNRRKNGEIYREEALVSPIVGEDGKITFFAATKRDITQQRKLEEDVARLETDLRHAQRIESIGRLAGGVAHDFNNMLQGVLGFTELLNVSTRNLPAVNADVQQIQSIVSKAQRLTRQLLAFGRKQVVNPDRFDVNDFLNDMKALYPRLLGVTDLQMTLELEKDLPPVYADSGQVEQVFLNLLINARDAAREDVPLKIFIRTATRNMAQEDLGAKSMTGNPGKYVVISIQDNASGIREDQLANIFDPFFTTKEKHKGTGLGLAVVYGIMKQHNGHVEVESQVGEGTTFTLYLPSLDGEMADASQKVAHPSVQHDNDAFRHIGGAILVVEDDKLLSGLAEQNVRLAGFEPLMATGEGAAWKLYNERRKDIRLLFTDVILGDGDGVRLADRIHEQDPKLPILLTSGYAKDSLGNRTLAGDGYLFLAKPYTRELFFAALRKAFV